MPSINIKYFFILLCTFYCYRKLLNVSYNLSQKIYVLLSIIVICIPIHLINEHFHILAIPYSVICLFIAIKLITKQNFSLCLNATIISSGFAYFTFFICSIFTSFLGVIIHNFNWNEEVFYSILHIVLGCIQLLLISLIFKLSRFKKGMPFLYENEYNRIGIIYCIIVLIATSLLTAKEMYMLIILLTITAILTITTYIWWKFSIKKDYLRKNTLREIERLESIIKEQQMLIEKYQSEHDRLAEIIHRDNKLIPSLSQFVADLIEEYSNSSNTMTSEKAKDFYASLENIMQERSFIIQNNPSIAINSGSIQLNALLSYLTNKASLNKIEITGEVENNLIKPDADPLYQKDLCTLIADLLDNAIIACTNTQDAKIKFSLKITENILCCEFLDTGNPFSQYILLNIGKLKVTTRTDSGGSGIGLFNSIQICKKYNASFEICENINSYTKKVCVRFDKKSLLTINASGIYLHKRI